MGRLLRLAHVTITWSGGRPLWGVIVFRHRRPRRFARTAGLSRCGELQLCGVDTSKGGVVMDAFVVDGFDAEPGHPVVIAQRTRRGPHHVLDENRTIVRLHRHVTFIRPLEQREDRARSRSLCDIDQVFRPHHDRPVALVARPHTQRDVPALVVGPVIADRPAARADAGDGNPDSDCCECPLTIAAARQVALVVHPCRCPGHRR